MFHYTVSLEVMGKIPVFLLSTFPKEFVVNGEVAVVSRIQNNNGFCCCFS